MFGDMDMSMLMSLGTVSQPFELCEFSGTFVLKNCFQSSSKLPIIDNTLWIKLFYISLLLIQTDTINNFQFEYDVWGQIIENIPFSEILDESTSSGLVNGFEAVWGMLKQVSCLFVDTIVQWGSC